MKNETQERKDFRSFGPYSREEELNKYLSILHLWLILWIRGDEKQYEELILNNRHSKYLLDEAYDYCQRHIQESENPVSKVRRHFCECGHSFLMKGPRTLVLNYCLRCSDIIDTASIQTNIINWLHKGE